MKLTVPVLLLVSSVFMLSACGGGEDSVSGDSVAIDPSGYAVRPAPTTINIMQHSSNDFSAAPIAADQAQWHAFFAAPATPTVTLTETTDLSLLNSFHLLYISKFSIDSLSAADMAVVRDWTTAGGTLVVNDADGSGASAFGAFLGANYAFSSVAAPNGDSIVVTNAGHRVLTAPNVLDAVALSNWGSSVHAAFDSVGSAYTCVADDTDGTTSLPVLCATPYGLGAVIITGFDPECSCHDDHLTGGTNSGSELFENFVLLLYRP